jgi:hypothetical protein
MPWNHRQLFGKEQRGGVFGCVGTKMNPMRGNPVPGCGCYPCQRGRRVGERGSCRLWGSRKRHQWPLPWPVEVPCAENSTGLCIQRRSAVRYRSDGNSIMEISLEGVRLSNGLIVREKGEIEMWRNSRSFVCLVAGTAVVAIISVCGTALGSGNPSITNTNVQVNQVFDGPFVPNGQNEPSLAQNPKNAQNLIAGANDDLGEPPCTNTTPSKCQEPAGISSSGFYASFDGGQTWPCQGLIDLSAFNEYAEGDPWQTFDSQGDAYYGTLAIPDAAPAGPADFFVAKSTDGGCTYPTAAKVSGAPPPIDDDKPSIAADASSASPFLDNVYAAWTTFVFGKTQYVQIVFSRSTDGGATWSNPRPVSPAFLQFAVKGVPAREAPTVKVGPDGTVYIAWVAAANPLLTQGLVEMAISHDGGRTFPGPTLAWPPLRIV